MDGMSSNRRLLSFASSVALLLGGCTKKATYGYERTYHVQFPEDYDPAPITAEARQVLARARTVAFHPPDYCTEPRDRAAGVSVDSNLLRLDCGVIVSSLERSAEEVGFKVVSWRTLRGAERPIEYAKQSGVEVLFEINELAFDWLRDRDAKARLTFFEDHDATPATPVSPTRATAERCATRIKKLEGQIIALSGTIDIKMVRVSDGQNLWHYRRTRGVDFNETSTERFQKGSPPNAAALAGLPVAGLGIAGGLLMATGPFCFNGSAQCEADSDTASSAFLVVGLIAGVIGVVGVMANQPPAVDDVLCAVDPVAEPELTARGQTKVERSDTYSFEEHVETESTHDRACQRV